MKKISVFLILFWVSFKCLAAKVDTVSIYHSGLQKAFPCVVIKPDSYKKKKLHFPTVYLLHGYSGSYSDWIKKVPELQQYADQFQMLIVCPDGGYSSWYFNSPIDTSMAYERYISKEIVTFIDAHYRTLQDPTKRAITGLSMGGHGSLYLAIKHPTIYGIVGSMSGGVDLRSSTAKFDIAKRIGDVNMFPERWLNYSIIGMVKEWPSGLKAIIDCGVDDFFFAINRNLHELLLTNKIGHEYIERPGMHNWNYWSNAVFYQLNWINKQFQSTTVKL